MVSSLCQKISSSESWKCFLASESLMRLIVAESSFGTVSRGSVSSAFASESGTSAVSGAATTSESGTARFSESGSCRIRLFSIRK